MVINFKDFNINALEPQSEFEKEVKNFLTNWFNFSETVEVSTSGSTGAPKKLEVEKLKMRNSAKMTCDFLKLQESHVALLCLPIAYISGKMMMVRAVERKLIIEIVEPSINPLAEVGREIDFCAMTPLQVEHSLIHIHKIKNLIIGGAQVSENLKNKIQKHLEITESQSIIFETYGMSETLSHIALKQIYPKAEPYFTVLDSIQISQDERGCLRIIAPKLTNEILQTNDIVELIDDRHFRFLGRADFVINSGGVKIFPEQLENFIKKELAKFGIENELLITGLQDEVLGQKLILIIEGQEDIEILQRVDKMNFEEKYYRPKEVVFLEKFPRSANGKILRNDVFK